MSASDAISPTAHYTGYVWARSGISHPELTTREGRLLFESLHPLMLAGHALGRPSLELYLLARHRAIDALLERAIEQHGITQVVEVAAGLSPRGWRFAQRYGEKIAYFEADLPAMAARKRRALERIGSLGERIRSASSTPCATPGRVASRRSQRSSIRAPGWRSSPRVCWATSRRATWRRCGAASPTCCRDFRSDATSPTCISEARRRWRCAPSGWRCQRSSGGGSTCTSPALRTRPPRCAKPASHGPPSPGPTRSRAMGAGGASSSRIYLRHQPKGPTTDKWRSRRRMIRAILYSDPACPWAYSECPALRVIEWRYGAQLDWRLVVIGLTEDASQYVARGYTPLRGARGQLAFRRYGMPFSPAPKERVSATARACRAVVAARLAHPGSEWRVFRALQLANFTSSLVLDDDAQLGAVIDSLPGVDGAALIAALDRTEVSEAYERDRAESRTASGSAAELQGKTATTDGPVRFTAPSIVLRSNGTQLVAGGFQPVEAYDVLIANLDPTLAREPPPETPGPLLEHFQDGLTTQEVAALLTHGNDAPDRHAAETALLELMAAGRATREPLGDDALWLGRPLAIQARSRGGARGIRLEGRRVATPWQLAPGPGHRSSSKPIGSDSSP